MLKFRCLATITALISIAATAGMAADNRDVVVDTNNHIVKNSFNNCVRTKWEGEGDKCQAKSAEIPAPTPVVTATQTRKPIRHSRSYLVFFDFDKATLTDNAIDIIKKANSEALKNTGEISFSITGHADRSGSAAYNMKLSKRRAVAVKDELVELGAEGREIETFAKGESQPLIPTADGVKEPQNRRVEIIYNVEE